MPTIESKMAPGGRGSRGAPSSACYPRLLWGASCPLPRSLPFLTDLHEFTVSDGSYVEGPRKGIAIMLKDKKKYSSTGGWAFQAWAGGDPKKPLVTDPVKQCFECHQPKKDQDYVYSTYIP